MVQKLAGASKVISPLHTAFDPAYPIIGIRNLVKTIHHQARCLSLNL